MYDFWMKWYCSIDNIEFIQAKELVDKAFLYFTSLELWLIDYT